jgi:hypothetical protein
LGFWDPRGNSQSDITFALLVSCGLFLILSNNCKRPPKQKFHPKKVLAFTGNIQFTEPAYKFLSISVLLHFPHIMTTLDRLRLTHLLLCIALLKATSANAFVVLRHPTSFVGRSQCSALVPVRSAELSSEQTIRPVPASTTTHSISLPTSTQDEVGSADEIITAGTKSNVSNSMKTRLLAEASNTCGCSTTPRSRRQAPTQLLLVVGVGILALLVAAEEGMLF